MSKPNPIEQEMEKLNQQWDEFIDSERPIFRWLIDPGASQLANAFVKLREQFAEDNPDFFIGLHTPFTDQNQFGFDLANEINTAITEGLQDAATEADEEEGAGEDLGKPDSHEPHNEFDWQPPVIKNSSSGYSALLKMVQQAIALLADYIDHLVLVIMPADHPQQKAWINWWQQCCDLHQQYRQQPRIWPKELRLVIFDSTEVHQFDRLVAKYPQQMHSVVAAVDMPGAIDRIVKEADDGSPGAKFRQHLIHLNRAVEQQNVDNMLSSSTAAIAIAEDQHWLELWITVLLTRAAGYLNSQSFEKAIQDYRQAKTLAVQGEEEKIPACDKLHLQALISEATAQFTAKQLQAAAHSYYQAAKLAEQQNNTMLCMESWRMRSFCLERCRDRDEARQSATKALKIARTMSEDERRASTLPFLGEALLRLAPDGRYKKQVNTIMTELLDEHWRQQAEVS